MAVELSVALCTYDGEAHLEEQLESIASQSLLPDEMVVCDDGSKDQTMGILYRFGERCPFKVRIFQNEANLGTTKNFEKAIRLCEGRIIALSDQDDAWNHDKLRKLMGLFDADSSVGVVFSDAEIVDEGLNPLGYTMWGTLNFDLKEQKTIAEGKPLNVLLRHNVVMGAAMAFKSEFLKQIVPMPESWIHDEWIALVIAAFADMNFFREPLVQYRQHRGQQIGGLKKDGGSGWQKPARYGPDVYGDMLNHYSIFLKRLRELESKGLDCRKALERVNDRMEDLYLRSHLPKEKYKRVPAVFKNTIRGRYHTYSSGFLSAAKDIFFK